MEQDIAIGSGYSPAKHKKSSKKSSSSSRKSFDAYGFLKSREKKYAKHDLKNEKKDFSHEIKQMAMRTNQDKKDRSQDREEAGKYAEGVVNRQYQGLDPQKRKAMQYEADRQIQRGSQTANRRLLGEQSQRGIVGKGGIGYAQQADLENSATEARGQSRRDIDKLDSDLALKKMAASIALEQGEVSNAQLDRQRASDEINLKKEKRRQRAVEDTHYKQFSRI